MGAGRCPRRLRGTAAAGGLGAVRRAAGQLDQARPGDGAGRGREAVQRAGGVHARRRVHPRRVRRARILGGGRLLRARPGRRRRHGLADGRVGRERRAQPRPVAHGHPPLRPPVPQPGLHAGPCDRGLRHLLRHQVPEPRAPGRPAAAAVAGLPAADRAGRVVRREVGLGAGQLVRSERGRGRRVAAPARLGRRELVARDPRGGDGHARARRAVRRELVRQVRGARPRVAGAARLPLRQRRVAPARLGHLHPDAERAAAASSATSPSPGWSSTASGS